MPRPMAKEPRRIWPGIAAALGSNVSADVTSMSRRRGGAIWACRPRPRPTAVAEAHTGGTSTVTFDINAALAAKVAAAGEALDWKRSVVDLLKLYGKDSSVGARKHYMAALGLDAGTAGTAEGNEALRSALLKSIAANGGHLPSNLA